MHYANGRLAVNGDPVIGKSYSGVVAGTIHSLITGTDTCNCSVAVAVVGGVYQLTCQNVSNFYHAEDALAAITPKIEVQTVAASNS